MPIQIVYAQQPFPLSWTKSIFLAGPTPRADKPVPSWRGAALERLDALGYDGVVFVPEPADGGWGSDYSAQVDWESQALNFADVIVFWVPRDLDTLPGFTTNVEFGRWVDSHKIVLGHPPDAPKTRYLDTVLREVTAGATVRPSLDDVLVEALGLLGDGVLRTAGERHIPLHIWQTLFFQSWYDQLKRVGHRLDDAKIRWIFYLPGAGKVLAGVIWVKIWVESEGRHKANEWIFGRTDVSSVVLLHRPRHGSLRLDALLDAKVVLIREFRSSARTDDGFVHELPGGSCAKPDLDPREVAAHEVREETGLEIEPERLVAIGSRQAMGAVSTHHVHLFMADLTANEMHRAHKAAEERTVFGNKAETERTLIELMTVKELLESSDIDWSTIGMVMKALYDASRGRSATAVM